MERYTQWADNGKHGAGKPGKDCFTRLAQYEDTGLAPEQIFEMDKLYSEKCKEVESWKCKVKELLKQLETTCKDIRERTEQDYVCGLCEYGDCVYIGAEGEYCGECPGFEKADCFTMRESFRKQYLGDIKDDG